MAGFCILLCILHFSLHVNKLFLSPSAWILCYVAWKNVFPREEKNIFKRRKFIVPEYFLQISEKNNILFCKNKIKLYLCTEILSHPAIPDTQERIRNKLKAFLDRLLQSKTMVSIIKAGNARRPGPWRGLATLRADFPWAAATRSPLRSIRTLWPRGWSA